MGFRWQYRHQENGTGKTCKKFYGIDHRFSCYTVYAYTYRRSREAGKMHFLFLICRGEALFQLQAHSNCVTMDPSKLSALSKIKFIRLKIKHVLKHPSIM